MVIDSRDSRYRLWYSRCAISKWSEDAHEYYDGGDGRGHGHGDAETVWRIGREVWVCTEQRVWSPRQEGGVDVGDAGEMYAVDTVRVHSQFARHMTATRCGAAALQRC